MIDKPILGEDTYLDPLFVDDIVGCWLFNEGSGNKVFDLSGNGNDITLSGATWVPGQFGSVINFDGDNDYGYIGNIDLTGTNKLTITFWFTISVAGADDTLIEMSDNYNSYTDSFIIFKTSANTVKAGVKGNVNYSDWNSASVSINTWYFVAVIMDMSLGSSEVKVYLNGQLSGAVNNNYNNTGNFGNRPFYIGARGGTSLFAPVKIDNITYHKRILSTSEIALLYREPFWGFKQRDSGIYTRI